MSRASDAVGPTGSVDYAVLADPAGPEVVRAAPVRAHIRSGHAAFAPTVLGFVVSEATLSRNYSGDGIILARAIEQRSRPEPPLPDRPLTQCGSSPASPSWMWSGDAWMWSGDGGSHEI